MAALLADREPSYRLADLTVDSSSDGAGGVARRILEAVRGRRAEGVEPQR
jgi:hypothetical protein